MLRSLRTTLSVIFGLLITLAIVLTSYTGLRMTRQAYLNLALRDLEFMSDMLMKQLVASGEGGSDQALLQEADGPLRHLLTDYFEANKMTGYPTLIATDGRFLWHPKGLTGKSMATDMGSRELASSRRARLHSSTTPSSTPGRILGRRGPGTSLLWCAPYLDIPTSPSG